MTSSPQAPARAEKTIHRIVVAWEPRRGKIQDHAGQLLGAIEWLRALPALSGAWSAPPRTEGAPPVVLSDPAAAIRSLSAGAYPPVPVRVDPPEHYKQSFYLGSMRRWRGRISVLCGASSAALGVQAPNRFDLSIRAPLTPTELRQILVGLISVYKPVWGFAAAETYPRVSPAVDIPPVGWLTYLSPWFGPAPTMDEPALVTPVGRFGTIIQLFPEVFDVRDEAHRAAIRRAAAALRERGVLRPFSGNTS